MVDKLLSASDDDRRHLEDLLHWWRRGRGRPRPQPAARRVLNPGGLAAARFQITGTSGDYWTAKLLDGDTPIGSTVAIAKPHHLRRTPFDGETIGSYTYTYTTDYARSSSDGTFTEAQVVTPAITNDFTEILAIGGLANPAALLDGSGNPITWQAEAGPHIWTIDVT